MRFFPRFSSLSLAFCLLTGMILPAWAESVPDEPQGTAFLLEVKEAVLGLTLPEGFTCQFEPPLDDRPYPSYYTLQNEETGITMIVYSEQDSPMDQQILLGKLRDKGNKFILFEDVEIGPYRYLAYTNALQPHVYNFLLLTETGYSYRFYYSRPVDQKQVEIPEEAIAILATLQIIEEGA